MGTSIQIQKWDAPGLLRFIDSVLDRDRVIELSLGRLSAPPECVRVRERATGIAVEFERSGAFLSADRNGREAVAAVVVFRRCGWGVCWRGGGRCVGT